MTTKVFKYENKVFLIQNENSMFHARIDGSRTRVVFFDPVVLIHSLWFFPYDCSVP